MNQISISLALDMERSVAAELIDEGVDGIEVIALEGDKGHGDLGPETSDTAGGGNALLGVDGCPCRDAQRVSLENLAL